MTNNKTSNEDVKRKFTLSFYVCSGGKRKKVSFLAR